MNYNAIIAALVLKGILTKEEAEKLVEDLNNRPQSTLLADAIEQIKGFISEAVPKLEDSAKKVAAKTAEKVASEAAQIDEAVQNEAKKVEEAAEKPHRGLSKILNKKK